MQIVIEGIETSPEDFVANPDMIYALFIDRQDAIGAAEYAHRFAQLIGFDSNRIITEHFFYKIDNSTSKLNAELSRLSARSITYTSGAIVVLPGLSRQAVFSIDAFDPVDLVAYCFALRKQLSGIRLPCFVPFHTVDLCVKKDLLYRALTLVGLIKVEINPDSRDELPYEFMGDWAIEEAISMQSFPSFFPEERNGDFS